MEKKEHGRFFEPHIDISGPVTVDHLKALDKFKSGHFRGRYSLSVAEVWMIENPEHPATHDFIYELLADSSAK